MNTTEKPIKEQVVDYYNTNTNLSLEEIGEKFGYTKQYISNILKEFGISIKEQKHMNKVEELKEQVWKLSEFMDIHTTSEDISIGLGIPKRQVTVLNSNIGILLYELSTFRKFLASKVLEKSLAEGTTQQEFADQNNISLSYVRKQLQYFKDTGCDLDEFLALPSYEELVKDGISEEKYYSLDLDGLERMNFISEMSKMDEEEFKEKMGKPYGYYLIEYIQDNKNIETNTESNPIIISIKDCIPQ